MKINLAFRVLTVAATLTLSSAALASPTDCSECGFNFAQDPAPTFVSNWISGRVYSGHFPTIYNCLTQNNINASQTTAQNIARSLIGTMYGDKRVTMTKALTDPNQLLAYDGSQYLNCTYHFRIAYWLATK